MTTAELKSLLAEHGIDAHLVTGPGDLAFGVHQLFGGELRDEVVVVTGQATFRKDGHADTVFAAPEKELLDVSDVLGQVARGAHLDGGDPERWRRFSGRRWCFAPSRGSIQLFGRTAPGLSNNPVRRIGPMRTRRTLRKDGGTSIARPSLMVLSCY
jgi:hypothetical protein